MNDPATQAAHAPKRHPCLESPSSAAVPWTTALHSHSDIVHQQSNTWKANKCLNPLQQSSPKTNNYHHGKDDLSCTPAITRTLAASHLPLLRSLPLFHDGCHPYPAFIRPPLPMPCPPLPTRLPWHGRLSHGVLHELSLAFVEATVGDLMPMYPRVLDAHYVRSYHGPQ